MRGRNVLILSLGLLVLQCKSGPGRLRDPSVIQPQAEAASLAEKTVQRLRETGTWDVPSSDRRWLPLHLAASQGDLALVAALLKAGANPNAKGAKGETPLMLAAAQGDLTAWKSDAWKIVYLLLHNGADIDAMDQDGNTAIMYAASGTDYKAVAILLEHGSDPAKKNNRGATALNMADAVHAASAAGMLNQASQVKLTPLIWASFFDPEFALALVALGADVNASNTEGGTALHMAAMQGYADLASVLIKNGANVNAKTVKGESVLLWASLKGKTQMVELLKSAGAHN